MRDWRTFTKQVWGPTGKLSNDPFTPDEWVRWLMGNVHSNSEPRGTSPLLDEVLKEEAEKAGKLEVDWTAPP